MEVPQESILFAFTLKLEYIDKTHVRPLHSPMYPHSQSFNLRGFHVPLANTEAMRSVFLLSTLKRPWARVEAQRPLSDLHWFADPSLRLSNLIS
jgi:hypothetical protein